MTEKAGLLVTEAGVKPRPSPLRTPPTLQLRKRSERTPVYLLATTNKSATSHQRPSFKQHSTTDYRTQQTNSFHNGAFDPDQLASASAAELSPSMPRRETPRQAERGSRFLSPAEETDKTEHDTNCVNRPIPSPKNRSPSSRRPSPSL